MFTDSSLWFSSYDTPVAVTTTADSSLIDVTGAGSGNAPAMKGGVNSTTGAALAIGVDYGAGEGLAAHSLNITVGTTFTAAGAATLTVTLLAAPDNGSNAPGSYTTILSTAALPVANLIAGASFNIPIPPIELPLSEALPRFYKLNYAVATGPFTAGKLSAGIQINQPNIAEGSQFPGNFVSY
ncbi:MAG: hypothetical protein KGJ90_05065 [Patescibacteria group bacterium]|nr:hypothetical protein [Patescibacteria group bacterium]